MIIKPLTAPKIIPVTEALLRRLPKKYPKRKEIEQDLSNWLSGYEGEQSLDYYFSLLPNKEYLVFHDLRLFNGQTYFQMDVLVLTDGFILIIEVKNINGTLYFDTEHNQLIRTLENKKKRFRDPINQAKEHQEQLSQWLKEHGMGVPVEYIVCVSNPNSIIESSPGNQLVIDRVVNNDGLKQKIVSWRKQYSNPVVNRKEINKLSSLLLKEHTPPLTNINHVYGVEADSILTGVICSYCNHSPMIRISGKWKCPKCKSLSRNAHIQALNDYSLLIKPTITNVECRKFLMLESRHTTKRLLKAMQLKHNNTQYDREYYLKE